MNDRNAVLEQVHRLLAAYKAGRLGGEAMPEDENPHLDPASAKTTCILRCQWRSITSAIPTDCGSAPTGCMPTPPDGRCSILSASCRRTKRNAAPYSGAVQGRPAAEPTPRHLENTLPHDCGAVRRRPAVFLAQNHFRVSEIKAHIAAHKKDFPYLGGIKICNYWLHVLEAYTDCRFSDRENISIAPDTHVLQSSVRLGVLTEEKSAAAAMRKRLPPPAGRRFSKARACCRPICTRRFGCGAAAALKRI